MNANDLQVELLLSPAHCNLMATGAGAGNSVAFYMQSLTKDKSVFVSPTLKQSKYHLDAYCDFLTQIGLTHQVSRTNFSVKTFIKGIYKEIKFVNAGCGFSVSGDTHLMVENVTHLPSDVIRYIMKPTLHCSKSLQDTPFNMGWREFKYENGIPDYNTVVKQSWDAGFINWGDSKATRADETMYQGVNLITGYGARHNPTLSEDYKICLANLDDKDKLRLSGDWIVLPSEGKGR